MATQHRDDDGRFGSKMRDQDILKAFDYEAADDDPYLTVSEVQQALAQHFDIEVSAEAVRVRLEDMRETDLVAKREFGPSVAYRALVAPELSEEAAATSDERRETDRDEFTPL